MEYQGWIKIHRKLLDWEWFNEPQTLQLFLYCLLRANHTDTSWRGIDIKRGSFVTSLETISKETKLSVQQIRTRLKWLNSTHEITRSSTAKYTVITVANWDEYQDANRVANKQVTNKQQTTNKQLTTDKNDKKEKNKKKEKKYTTLSSFKKNRQLILREVSEKYPDKDCELAMDDFIEYCEIKDTGYKNFGLAFYKWVRSDKFNQYGGSKEIDPVKQAFIDYRKRHGIKD